MFGWIGAPKNNLSNKIASLFVFLSDLSKYRVHGSSTYIRIKPY